MNYNYNTDTGEDMNVTNEKITLTNNESPNCTVCGTKLQSKENYCPRCGKLNSRIKQKSDSSIEQKPQVQSTSSPITKEKITPSSIDYKRILLSICITLVLTSITLMIFSNGINSALGIDMSYYESELVSKFKMFFMNLSLLNVANINFVAKSQLISLGKVSLAIRHIIYPLMSILFIYISTKISFNKENTKRNTLYTSVAYGIIYGALMVIVGIIAGYTIELHDEISIKVSIGLISLFINSFIIGFIGSHLAIYKNEENPISYMIIKAFKIIVIGIAITAIILGILIYTKYGDSYEIIQGMSYYLGDEILYLYLGIVMILITASSWLFGLANFASFSVFGIDSFNILSLTTEFEAPVILLSIIPIILLIMVGRKLKGKYGPNQINLVAIFSGIYSIFMFGLAYFTRMIVKIDAKGAVEEISDFIYDEFGYIGEYFSDAMLEYTNGMSSSIQIGNNGIIMLIAAFILSFVFVYIGYKTKKIDNE